MAPVGSSGACWVACQAGAEDGLVEEEAGQEVAEASEVLVAVAVAAVAQVVDGEAMGNWATDIRNKISMGKK